MPTMSFTQMLTEISRVLLSKRQRDEERGGQTDHERARVATRQFHHGLAEEKEKIIGKPQ